MEQSVLTSSVSQWNKWFQHKLMHVTSWAQTEAAAEVSRMFVISHNPLGIML